MNKPVGRNDSCPCGSGKKYKKCHLTSSARHRKADMDSLLEAQAAKERIRQIQQGRGKPIIAGKMDDDMQFVAVGNTIHWSRKWKLFPDFLADYIRKKLGSEWGQEELAKPLAERHQILKWYDAYCAFQAAGLASDGIKSAPMTGIVACYLGLAYNLYLLEHNVELQERLIARLKDPGNFQGAYYELIVASILIRAGFTLTLEDETDPIQKHCEFAAISGGSGKRYWVEAKMRSIAGLLGRTAADGGRDSTNLSRLVPHLNSALKKPAADERLIFIDLNVPVNHSVEGIPEWVERAMTRLERYEREELEPDVSAYVFVTNMAFHRHLEGAPVFAAVPFGLGMPDFNRPGPIRLSEAYRRKQKHADAHAIVEALQGYLRFPSTFDGSLPSDALNRPSSRVEIGQTYYFADADEAGIVGAVTTASVNESTREALIGVTDTNGRSHILRWQMSDEDFSEYLQFPDAYFGRIVPGPSKPKDEFELFEWFMAVSTRTPREAILKWFANSPDFEDLHLLDDEELRILYCEGLVASATTAKTGSARSGPPGA